MTGVAGDERGGLGAEAVVAEGDGHKARAEGEVDLLGREIAFGADEQRDVAAGTIVLGQKTTLDAVVAVSDKALRVADRGDEIFNRRRR